jgi:hypothetical protein
MQVRASYDSTAKVVSTVVVLLLLGIVVATRSAVAAGVEAALLLLVYACSARGYAIVDGTLIVRRLIGDVRIPLDGIRQARVAGAEDLTGCIRLFGSGGLFGWYGLFRTSKLGKCTWYVTNRNNAVVLITQEKTVLVSPDDVDGFVGAFPSAPVLDAPGAYPDGSLPGKLIGGAVGIVAIAIAALALLYSPGPPSYTLTPESLTIHDRFYPVTLTAAAVDVDHIRVIDFGVDTAWQPTLRTNGFANPHYRSGWFRVASGKTIRMYRADSKRLVLLPPAGNGTPVLLETKDPEEFVREVRREWSTGISRALTMAHDRQPHRDARLGQAGSQDFAGCGRGVWLVGGGSRGSA